MALAPDTKTNQKSKENTAQAPQNGLGEVAEFGTEFQVGISKEQLQRTQAQPANARPADILALQRMIGNRAVQRMLNPQAQNQPQRQPQNQTQNQPNTAARPIIQRALKVGPANDSFEQEADRVARQVTRPTPSAAKAGKKGADDESVQLKPMLQLKSAAQQSSEAGFEASGEFQNRLNSTKGGGKALPEKTRSELEPRFGADLGAVRVHTNDTSDALNRDVQAKAFTRGNDIHFSKGAYNPGSSAGKQLLAHELTHTIQQTGGSQLQPKRSKKGNEETVARAFDGKAASIHSAKSATIQRVNVTTGDLGNSISLGEKFVNFFGFGQDAIFANIRKELAKYENATTWSARLAPLRRMIRNVGTWMATHQKAMTKGSKKAKTLGQLLAEITIELDGIISLGQQQPQQQAQPQPSLQGVGKVQAPKMPPMVQGAVQIPNSPPTLQGVGKIKPPIPPPPIVQQAVQLVVQLQNVGKVAVQTPQPLAQGAQVINNPNIPLPPPQPQQPQGPQGPQAKTPQQEDDDYMNQVDNKSLKYLSQGGVDHSKLMKGFHDGSDMSSRGVQANAKIAKYGLTLAEASAIGIYTAADYLYMNPAAAKDKGWMKAGLVNKELIYNNPATTAEIGGAAQDKHVDEAMLEGQLHNKVAQRGLDKLPDWKGDTWRGAAFSPTDFATKYPPPPTGETVFPAFTSTSRDKNKSMGFAKMNAKGNKIPILIHLNLKKGKNIRKLSALPHEREILLLPGATFAVTNITDSGGLKLVELDQTK